MVKSKEQIAVGMSGGIDSSMTAHLLLQAGYDVCGLTMKIWDGSLPLKDEGWSGCYGPGEERDIESAGKVCALLGIKHHVVDLTSEYKSEVLAYFRNEYLNGRTPNPCVRCNQSMKFGFLLSRAEELGVSFDYFATGHYARVQHDPVTERFLLLRGIDRSKDQSYFLSRLNQKQLSRVKFPLGELTKSQVRAIALELGWGDLAGKAESQDFIEAKNYSVLFNAEDSRPGAIVDRDGNELGSHSGIINYTIGQRRGLMGGASEPLYVTSIDGCSNTIKVGPKEDLFSRRLVAGNVNWIAWEAAPAGPRPVQVKIRQQHKEAPAMVKAVGAASDVVEVEFDTPQRAITPGQAAVFYSGDLVIGGAVIAKRL